MVASFVIPGHLTLKDVQRPAKGETLAQRLYRLACKAGIEGAYVARVGNADHLFAVSSRRGGDVFWLVDAKACTCGCEGFARFGLCGHVALVLAELGELPEPEPPASVAIAA